MVRKSNNNKSRFVRKTRDRNFIRQLYIYTEGEITEKEYLITVYNLLDKEYDCSEKFRISVKTSRGKSSPANILKQIKQDEKDLDVGNSYEIWVLIDQDRWPTQQINALLKTVMGPNRHVLVSIPKFEIWLLLHFEKGTGIHSPTELDQAIDKYIRDYKKHIPDGVITLDKVHEAISNSKLKVSNNAPSNTTVHLLIERMLFLAV